MFVGVGTGKFGHRTGRQFGYQGWNVGEELGGMLYWLEAIMGLLVMKTKQRTRVCHTFVPTAVPHVTR